MSIDTTFLRRCIGTLELAQGEISRLKEQEELTYDIYRAACVKEFELVLEQSGKLLRKRLAAYFSNNRQADRLPLKDLFRHAAKHGLMDVEATERWLAYRDNRNDTAHDYGEDFAEQTLKLLPAFIADAKVLADMIELTDDRPSSPFGNTPPEGRSAAARVLARRRGLGLRQPRERAQPRRERPRPGASGTGTERDSNQATG